MAAVLKSPAHHAGSDRGQYRNPGVLAFVSGAMAPEDRVLKSIRERTVKQGLPPINIGPEEGAILSLLVQACGAAKAVEVGTLAGYSACWIARALPEDGVLHTIEFDPRHASVARDNIKRAGLGSKVSVLVGAGSSVLPGLEAGGPYDFCFIDADKVNYPVYLEWACLNLVPGGIVAADNAYLFGKLHLEGKSAGEDAAAAAAMRRTLAMMADKSLFTSCCMLPTGEGLAVAVKK